MDSFRYLIIGNSVAAVGAVQGVRSVDGEGSIAIVAREPGCAYSRPLISYFLAGSVSDDRMVYRGPDFYARNRVNVIDGEDVTGIDCAARTVATRGGRTFGYERLLIAAGSRPIVPADVPGADAAGVFTFATRDDARALKGYVRRTGVRRALVVGAGMIGVKVTEALVRLGLGVTVVELAGHVLAGALDETGSELVQEHLRDSGVDVRCGTSLAEVRTQNPAVCAATLSDGTTVKCEVVVLAVGVRPNADFARAAGVEVDGGIVVDDTMQTSVPGLYAAGDVVRTRDVLTGRPRCIPTLPNAYRQGLIAGGNMAGGHRTYRGGIAMNAVEVLGLPTVSVGVVSSAGDGCEELSLLQDNPVRYRKVLLRGDRVIGAVFVGEIERAGIITGLIRSGIDVFAFRDDLLTEAFGVLSLPIEYRKHLVSGTAIEL